MNELNIFNLSPSIGSLASGNFAELAMQAGIDPYKVDNQQFTKMFVLVDGIYSKYSRFDKGLSQPVSSAEIAFHLGRKGHAKILSVHLELQLI
jgi:Plant transposon protein